MAEKRRKFDAEFREGAVRIVTETGKSIARGREGSGDQRDDPGELGVAGPRRAGTGPAGGPSARSWPGCGGRTRSCKKDNKELEMERDVLKRCMVLWVK